MKGFLVHRTRSALFVCEGFLDFCLSRFWKKKSFTKFSLDSMRFLTFFLFRGPSAAILSLKDAK
jgi:hypothetical protein